jgi:hypothetical protein
MTNEPENPHSARRRAWTLRSVSILASLVFVLAIFEIGLRLSEDIPWYEQLAEQQLGTTISRFPVGNKKFKVRKPLLAPVVTKPDTYRILFLGDSFTYGSGIADEKLTFPSLVTGSLAEDEIAIGSRDFIFYNGGIPGSLTRRWLGLYQESVALLDPNLVISVFFLRDGTRELGSIAGLSAIRESMQQYRERSFLFRNSRLYRLLIEQSKQREVGKTYFESISRAYLGSPEEIREWQAAQENLLSVRDDVLKRGGKFALVIFPILFGLTDDYPLQEVVDEIERFGISNNIPTFSLLPVFQGEDASALWVSPLDQHPNKIGHAIAAEAIATFVRQEHLDTPNEAPAVH